MQFNIEQWSRQNKTRQEFVRQNEMMKHDYKNFHVRMKHDNKNFHVTMKDGKILCVRMKHNNKNCHVRIKHDNRITIGKIFTSAKAGKY